MKAVFLRMLALLSLSATVVTPALAQWVEGTGQAVIMNGDVQRARSAARQAALRDAALRFEARVQTSDTVHNGVLTDSRLTVASQARASRVKVISERQGGGVLRLTLQADMGAAGPACQGGQGSAYRKRVAVAAFPLLKPEQAAFGGLGNAGRALPAALYQALLQGTQVQPFEVSERQLFADLHDAPTQVGADNRLDKTLALAREMNVQFVVSGVIEDISMVDPQGWGTSIVDRMQRGLGLSEKSRRFAVSLYVHDGFSGALVDERRFAISAPWDVDQNTDVGFGTAAFWHSGFGQAVRGVVNQMRAEVAQAIACQPFMARITRVDDQRVYLAAGAGSGIRPGDHLALYRSNRFLDAPGSMPELEDTHTELKITAVNPEFASGVIPVEAGRVNLQRDDIAVVW